MNFDHARCDPALYGHLQEPEQIILWLKFVQDFMQWTRSGVSGYASQAKAAADGFALFLMMMNKEKHFKLARNVEPEFRKERGTMTGIEAVDAVLLRIDGMRSKMPPYEKLDFVEQEVANRTIDRFDYVVYGKTGKERVPKDMRVHQEMLAKDIVTMESTGKRVEQKEVEDVIGTTELSRMTMEQGEEDADVSMGNAGLTSIVTSSSSSMNMNPIVQAPEPKPLPLRPASIDQKEWLWAIVTHYAEQNLVHAANHEAIQGNSVVRKKWTNMERTIFNAMQDAAAQDLPAPNTRTNDELYRESYDRSLHCAFGLASYGITDLIPPNDLHAAHRVINMVRDENLRNNLFYDWFIGFHCSQWLLRIVPNSEDEGSSPR